MSHDERKSSAEGLLFHRQMINTARSAQKNKGFELLVCSWLLFPNAAASCACFLAGYIACYPVQQTSLQNKNQMPGV